MRTELLSVQRDAMDDVMISAGQRMPLTWEATVASVRVRYETDRELFDHLAATVAMWWGNLDQLTLDERHHQTFHDLANGRPVRYGDLREAIYRAWLDADKPSSTPKMVADDRLCLDMLATWALNGQV